MKLRTIQARRSGGLTIIELMVSVTILIVMILMTNQLLSASRKTISIAEDAIAANADARAVADALRNDLAQLSKQGFLAITYLYDEGTVQTNPHLVFTSVGDYTSRLNSSVTAKAALIDYGYGAKLQTSNPKSVNDTLLSPSVNNPLLPPTVVMWRRARLLNADATVYPDDLAMSTPTTPVSLMDMCNLNQDNTNQPLMFNFIICLAGAETNTTAFTAYGPAYANGYKDAPRMVLPPLNLTQVTNTWPYLISNVQVLKIQWTDGSRDPATNSINWYDNSNALSNVTWKTVTVSNQWTNFTLNAPEYNITATAAYHNGVPAQYAALWTFRKQDNWPKAIRVELSVGMGVYSQPRPYEIVIELPN